MTLEDEQRRVIHIGILNQGSDESQHHETTQARVGSTEIHSKPFAMAHFGVVLGIPKMIRGAVSDVDPCG